MTKPNLMAELAACPFCGGKAEYRSKRYSGVGASGMEPPFISAGCPKCNVWFGGGQTEGLWNPELRVWTDRTAEAHSGAAAKWNRRTHHAELEAMVRDAIPASELAALLPGVYYMDPPDGGDVPVIEQVRRMAKDAARYRHIKLAPPMHYHFGSGEALDAAIDHAMHNSAREGGE